MPGNTHRISRHASSWICESCQSRLGPDKGFLRTFATSSQRLADPTKRSRLPDAPARTRFAPSPTGSLHLGSIRTALFNYLLARRTNGQFLLRIEDTDQKRTVPGAEERLYRDLRWAGLTWDEGPQVGGPCGPYRQSERLDFYHRHIQQLVQNRKAYRCFCPQERIDQLNRRRHEKGLPLGYDRKCMDLAWEEAEDRASRGESHVIRFKAPDEYPRYKDLVYGNTGHGKGRFRQRYIDEPVFDDPVLVKSDKFPTYHFANVVDDRLMHISHVIRGSEWMSSTPLHVALYDAFGWTPPHFGHVPLLVDQNKQKLSKRNFDSDISSFRDTLGIFPDALTNFAVLLGWSHQQASDLMTLAELEKLFDLKITKGNAMVNMQKLSFLQEKHARRIIHAGGDPLEQMVRDVAVEVLNRYGARTVSDFVGMRKLRDVLADLLHIETMPYQNPEQYAAQLSIFLTTEAIQGRKALDQAVPEVNLLPGIRIAASTILCVPQEHWKRAVLKDHLNNIQLRTSQQSSDADEKQRKVAKTRMYTFLRWALLGGAPGPDIPTTMEILGRDVSEARIREAILIAREVENATSRSNTTVMKHEKSKTAAEPWQAHKLPQQAPVASA